MTQLERIQSLRRKGFGARDIASVLSLTDAELREAEGRLPRQDSYYKRREAGKSMLRRVPSWWTGTTESYLRCVRMNFCDVLGEEP